MTKTAPTSKTTRRGTPLKVSEAKKKLSAAPFVPLSDNWLEREIAEEKVYTRGDMKMYVAVTFFATGLFYTTLGYILKGLAG